MHDAPSAKELIEAVKSFIDKTAMVQLTGHAAFHARVASNALATVLRELEQRPEAEARRAELVAAHAQLRTWASSKVRRRMEGFIGQRVLGS